MRTRLILFILVVCLLLPCAPCEATSVKPRPVTWEAIQFAADHQKIPAIVLVLILDVEKGYVGLKQGNDDGTYDLGPCQLNTINLPDYAKYGISEDDLRYNGPLNVLAAAIYVRKQIDEAIKKGKSGRFFILEGMGRYHSKTPKFKRLYQGRLVESSFRIKTKEDVRRVLQRANMNFNSVYAAWKKQQTPEGDDE